jgi:uncharacterized protein Yka (UPF0111/DUF47 family)
MFLSKVVKVCSKIDDYRRDMQELAMYKGLDHPDVLKLSMKLDKLINIYQEIVMDTRPYNYSLYKRKLH